MSTKTSAISVPLEARFHELADEWKRGRGHSSSLSVAKNHPAYQEIIKMGKPILPFIMRELEKRPDFWFAALREITGENPVPPELAGKVREIAAVWLQWGRDNSVRW